jgi:preprotein translocase subunit SecE
MSKTAVAETHEEGTMVEQAVSGPARLVQFLKDTRQEMRKVVTPTRNEVQSTTIIVIATVFVFAAYFALVDATLGHGVDQLIVKLTKH